MTNGLESVLNRNGYARLSDLESPEVQAISRELERYQVEFVAKTRPIWQPSFSFSGDSLYTWSRQWEYAYASANLPDKAGKILDAGSGLTFFPFLLAKNGHEVFCCDLDASLEGVFDKVNGWMDSRVAFRTSSIGALPYANESFDAICCVSVLEHATDRDRAVREFQRVLKPGGRLIITCDISLGGNLDIRYEDAATMLSELSELFEGSFPLDLGRPPDILTTDYFRNRAPWRLTWGRRDTRVKKWMKRLFGRADFYSLAVLGLTFVKRAA